MTVFYNTLFREVNSLPGSTDYEKFDNLFTFHYLRYHFNDLINKLNGDGHYYSLFMSPYLFEASRMLSMEERCNNKVILDMCYLLYPEVLSFPFSSYGSNDQDITSDKWRNVLFDPKRLPQVTLNNDRSCYDAREKEKNAMMKPLISEVRNKELSLQMFQATMAIYYLLQDVNEISQYFDEPLYCYIQCMKDNMQGLVKIFSKLCGIYDQLFLSETCGH